MKPTSREPDFFSQQVTSAQRFYRNFSAVSSRLKVVSGGREQCAQGYRIARDNFPFTSIEFVVGGKGWLVLNQEEHALSPGSVFAYGPGVPHVIHNNDEACLEKYFLNLTGREATDLLQSVPLLGRIVHCSAPSALLGTFEELVHYGLSQGPCSDRICVTLAKLLVLKIAETAIDADDARSPAFATYQKCRHFINNSYREMTSLKQVAQACHVDAAYLCRLFKRFDQQSPYQYLQRLRMNYAAELLLVPGTLVKHVADKLEFDDVFHFSRTFKKALGISPSQFGKLHN